MEPVAGSHPSRAPMPFHGAETMNLLRRFMPLTLCLAAWAAALAPAAAQPVRPAGYLFATFKNGANPLAEQIYLGLSIDGRKWTALNRAEPILISTIGDKGVRDPYLLRAHDGKTFYLIATDLSIYHTKDWRRAVTQGSRSIIIWESTDLVRWSQPRRVAVAPEDAGCTWAPEAIYDEEKGDYLVFWASTTKRDDFAKHRIWAARTRDFKNFSAPFIYIEKPNTIIDTTIVRDGQKYYRFTKDEKFKAITMETSLHLEGPWTDVPNFSQAKMVGYEGPEVYVIEPGDGKRPPVWTLILDYYSKGLGYQPFVTKDLATGQFEASGDFTFPFEFRHGSILPLSAAELARIRAAYPDSTK
jgi:hypothetical protein